MRGLVTTFPCFVTGRPRSTTADHRQPQTVEPARFYRGLPPGSHHQWSSGWCRLINSQPVHFMAADVPYETSQFARNCRNSFPAALAVSDHRHITRAQSFLCIPGALAGIIGRLSTFDDTSGSVLNTHSRFRVANHDSACALS